MRKLIWAAVSAGVLGCAEIENDATVDSDSLVVIPIGPGTDPGVVVPPDTPRSQPADPDVLTDSVAHRQ